MREDPRVSEGQPDDPSRYRTESNGWNEVPSDEIRNAFNRGSSEVAFPQDGDNLLKPESVKCSELSHPGRT